MNDGSLSLSDLASLLVDHDAHVVAWEDFNYYGDSETCHCCCCTGECRDHDDGSPSLEDALSGGFAEGDLL